jgi:hypothetical protein
LTPKVAAKVKDDLIGTGIFLERDTYQLFKDWMAGRVFSAYREYPYNYGVHPRIIDGTVDVLAETSIGNGRIVLILPAECKKADPKLKHWVFEPHRPAGIHDMPYFMFTKDGENSFTQGYNLPNLGFNTYGDYENCVNVFEFSEDKGALYKGSDKMLRPYFAIKQANEAVPGIVEKIPSLSRRPAAKNFVIPIVVTTANLWVTQYDPQDISKATGAIDAAKLDLVQKDWLLYHYPVALQEQTSGSLVGSTTDGIIRPDKRPTFVVNSVKLPDFVTNLTHDLEGYF